MASSNVDRKRRLFPGQRRSRTDGLPPIRVLTAAATHIDLSSRFEGRKNRSYRGEWQYEALNYGDSIPEIDFGVEFLADGVSRMRYFPAAYPLTGDTDYPVPLANIEGVPQPILDACTLALTQLGNGKLALAPLMHSLSTNLSLAGECYMLGRYNIEEDVWAWSIASIDEIIIYGDEWKLREVPMDPQGVLGWITLDPEVTYLARMWKPWHRFRTLADSPMRALMDSAETLAILRRQMRADGRARVAQRGILLMPKSASITSPNNDNMDPASDNFMSQFIEMMTAGIADEGVASAAAPAVMQLDVDAMDKVRLLDLFTKYEGRINEDRAELVGCIATGLKLPRSIIEGTTEEANHWGAWLTSDNMVRQYMEPHVIVNVDCLTTGYLRPFIQGMANDGALDPEMVRVWRDRVCIWYDPTPLVTPPDMTASSETAYNDGIISAQARRRYSGFTDEDAPDRDDALTSILRHVRTLPPNFLVEALSRLLLQPGTVVPPITIAGAVPGWDGTKVDVGTPPALPAGTAPPAAGDTAPPTPSVSVAPPAPTESTQPGPPDMTAAGVVTRPHVSARNRSLGKRMAASDRAFRTQLIVAANAAMQRRLERTGQFVRTKVAKDRDAKVAIAKTRAEHVTRVLGADKVRSLGTPDSDLIGNDWGTLHDQFHTWATQNNAAILAAALTIAGIDAHGSDAQLAARKLADGVDAGWKILDNAMNQLGQHLLYNPAPGVDAAEALAALNPETLVPTGIVRAVIAVVGGLDPTQLVMTTTDSGVQLPGLDQYTVGQVSAQATVGDLLTSAGATPAGSEWIYGTSGNVFQPHADLDGTVSMGAIEFEGGADDDDPWAADPSDFPYVARYYPDDHDGCACDVQPLWASNASDGDSSDGGSDDSGE